MGPDQLTQSLEQMRSFFDHPMAGGMNKNKKKLRSKKRTTATKPKKTLRRKAYR